MPAISLCLKLYAFIYKSPLNNQTNETLAILIMRGIEAPYGPFMEIMEVIIFHRIRSCFFSIWPEIITAQIKANPQTSPASATAIMMSIISYTAKTTNKARAACDRFCNTPDPIFGRFGM